MRSETVLRGSKSLAKWQAEHLAVGGEIFPTLASLQWFIRQNKDELQAHNAIIPGKGSRATMLTPYFEKVTTELLLETQFRQEDVIDELSQTH